MKFKFFNYGGTDQLSLESADDLRGIDQLDETFWMATSAPVEQLKSDKKLIAVLDTDSDKRIVSKDIRREYSWLKKRLSNWNGVTACSDVLKLSHLDSKNDEGKKLLSVAKLVLNYLGKSDADELKLAEVRNHLDARKAAANNGDGVIVPAQLTDDDVKAFAKDILATTGGADDLAGEKGVGVENLDSFLKSAKDLLTWEDRAAESSDERSTLFPLDDGTAQCYDLLQEIREKVDYFFDLCRCEKLSEATGVAISPAEQPVDAAGPEKLSDRIARAPISRPNPAMVLDLGDSVNPAHREIVDRVNREVFGPLLGTDNDPKSEITEEDWRLISWTLAPYEEWLKSKAGGEVEKLGPDKLRGYLDSELPDRLRALIEEDLTIGKELGAVDDLERLILLQRWLLEVCRNFISFHNLYDPGKRALFEEGRMVLGGRSFTLNIRVADVNKHSALAKESGMLLLYSEVTGGKPEEKFNIVTPVTNLSRGELGPERRGVLFDLKNREWDVRVLKVVDNPVSLWDELCKPFRRVTKLIGGSFEKLGASAEKQIGGVVTGQVAGLEKDMTKTLKQKPPGAAPAKPGAAPAQRSSAREWVFSASVAVAALSSSFAFVSKTVASLNEKGAVFLRATLFILGIILLGLILAGAAVFVVALRRLRRRNLASLLHASGWAVNAEMRVTSKLARVFAPKPVHPAGFSRIASDITSTFVKRAVAIQEFAVQSTVSSSKKAAETDVKEKKSAN